MRDFESPVVTSVGSVPRKKVVSLGAQGNSVWQEQPEVTGSNFSHLRTGTAAEVRAEGGIIIFSATL